MTMTSEASNHDPCPMVPETFVNPLGIPKLVREIKRGVPAGEDGVAERAEDDTTSNLEGVRCTSHPRCSSNRW